MERDTEGRGRSGRRWSTWSLLGATLLLVLLGVLSGLAAGIAAILKWPVPGR